MNTCFSIFHSKMLSQQENSILEYYHPWEEHNVSTSFVFSFDLGFIELFVFETLPLDDIQTSQMKESVLSCCLLSLGLLWSPL